MDGQNGQWQKEHGWMDGWEIKGGKCGWIVGQRKWMDRRQTGGMDKKRREMDESMGWMNRCVDKYIYGISR